MRGLQSLCCAHLLLSHLSVSYRFLGGDCLSLPPHGVLSRHTHSLPFSFVLSVVREVWQSYPNCSVFRNGGDERNHSFAVIFATAFAFVFLSKVKICILVSVLVGQGCCNKVLQTGDFKLKKPILSQVWRLESEGRASAGPRSPKGSRGESSLATSNFWCSACSWLVAITLPVSPCLHLLLLLLPSVSDKDLLELGAPWILEDHPSRHL